MSDASKVFFLGLIGLCEVLEVLGSDEGLLALWVGLATLWLIQQTGGHVSSISFAIAVPIFAYGIWDNP